jgi:hypothetical protein
VIVSELLQAKVTDVSVTLFAAKFVGGEQVVPPPQSSEINSIIPMEKQPVRIFSTL